VASFDGVDPNWSFIMRSIRPLREWPRALSARRLVLLATVASLGVAAAAVGPNVFHQAKLPTYATANAAESTQRPVGFADLVQKVKPAVISVRVKVDAGSEMMSSDGDRPFPPNSHMQRFFHHFGMPDGENAPDNQRRPNGHIMTAQGSGFHHGRWLRRDQQPRRGQG
jgi:serine protease Do